ncbi:MAG: RluA family pseudouridine synthase [Lachnospiraceae bacterium]
MHKKKVSILYEDKDIIVCEKPQGMPVQSDKTVSVDLLHYLKTYLYEKEKKQREPEIYLIHRLDRPVGGIVVFAKTKEAAANLGRQIQEDKMEKTYQAILTGILKEPDGVFIDYLLKDPKTNTSKVVDEKVKGAKRAELEYEVLDEIQTDQGDYTYVLIHLKTGRHHQIRAQFAAHHAGIYGDTKYNPIFQKKKKKYVTIGLYATRLAFFHPTTGEKMVFKTEPKGEAFDILDAEEF